MQLEITRQELATKSRRHYFRRRAVNVIRDAADKVPQLGDPRIWLKNNGRVRDAVLTLHAMNLSIERLVTFVDRPCFTAPLGYAILSRAVSEHMVDMCFMALSLTTEG